MIARRNEKLRDDIKILHRVLKLASNGSIRHAHHKRTVPYSNNELRAIRTEADVNAPLWLKHPHIKVRSVNTCQNKVSFIYSTIQARKEYFKLTHKINSFENYASDNMNLKHHYLYELTVNPQKLTYENVTGVAREIIKHLRQNVNVAMIYKAVESTFVHAGINVHCHFLIVATGQLNQKNTDRDARGTAKKLTNSDVQTHIRKSDNQTKAVDYVVKQKGLPLPLKHGKGQSLNQFQRFDKLPNGIKDSLLADEINASKGVQRHRLYGNRKNKYYAEWNAYRKAWSNYQKTYNATSDMLAWSNYRAEYDATTRMVNRANKKAEYDYNRTSTVFGVSFKKLYPNARKRSSKHHYSEYEHWNQLEHKNIYYKSKIHSRYYQYSLFLRPH